MLDLAMVPMQHQNSFGLALDTKPPPAVAVLHGSDSTRHIEWGTSYVYYHGNNDVGPVLSACGFPWTRIHISPSYFRQSRRWDLHKYSVIFNAISDPDQAPCTLRVA